MAIRVFEVDTDKPKGPSSDIVGRFRAGRQIQGRPVALTEWRVTSGDPEVLDTIANLYGAAEGPQAWETKSDEKLEIVTEQNSVEIIMDATNVRSRMVLRGMKGIIRECDGVTQADNTPCVCPSGLADRKQASRDGSGCDPDVTVFFRLADDPDLGRFRFSTGSWNVAKEIGGLVSKLESIGGDARVAMSIERVEWTDKASGQDRSFHKAKFDVLGAVES